MRNSRIAIVYDCLFPYTTGGGERLYRSYAEHMHRYGLQVDYLTARQWSDPATPSEPEFRIVPISRMLRLYDGTGVRSSTAALQFSVGLFAALVRRRRSYHTVVVSALPVLNVFAARAALVGSGTRVVVDYLEVWGRRQWVDYAGPIIGHTAWLLQRLAVAVTPLATCHSRLTANQLVREGLRSTALISPGLIDGESVNSFAAKSTLPPYVLYVGRHIPDKQVEALPAAVAEARRSVPGLRLVVLGEGPSSSDVDAALASAQASEWAERPGFVSQDRLVELMRGAAALINPSRREGYGLVVVEAAAHGTPVVLVGGPGNAATELVEPGVNGFVAPSASAADLGDAIVRAIRGGTELRLSSRSWYESAVTTRTVARTVENLLRVLDLIPRAPAGAAARPDDAATRSADTTEGTH
ncbi:glycosyltransferase [Microbacterium sp.]|uniref:glycosyltransferase family 4 protein n=1 Tax=Microbacterium sp. TaxID=51671 RepID=UPI0025F94EEC|nr:glycosyltransferase [Microbacterium sp.]